MCSPQFETNTCESNNLGFALFSLVFFRIFQVNRAGVYHREENAHHQQISCSLTKSSSRFFLILFRRKKATEKIWGKQSAQCLYSSSTSQFHKCTSRPNKPSGIAHRIVHSESLKTSKNCVLFGCCMYLPRRLRAVHVGLGSGLLSLQANQHPRLEDLPSKATWYYAG